MFTNSLAILLSATVTPWFGAPGPEVAPPSEPAPAPAPSAAEVAAGIQKFYLPITDFKADFIQVVQRKHLPRPIKRKGKVFFKRPGMMRWDYSEPDRVLYVSDGTTLWNYDVENRTVTKLTVKDSELYGALKFLFGEGDLAADFELALGKPQGNLVLLELVPKLKQSSYKRLVLMVDPKTWQISRSELVDPLDTVSTISFESATYGVLKPEGFKFTPPEGVPVQDLTQPPK
jgi:outer membrane lipoprotein carrier protein